MDVISSSNEYSHTRSEDVDLEALSICVGFFYIF
jgi:hypothetical protein